MKRSIGILAAITIAIIMTNAASAQSMNLTTSPSFKDHNFAITKFMINGTAGTPKALEFATVEEPLMIIGENQTIAISLKEWGADSSRAGVLLAISNGTGPGTVEHLVPLQRYGWGSQIDEVAFGNLKIKVGLTEIFRGRTAEYVRLSVMAIKLPKK